MSLGVSKLAEEQRIVTGAAIAATPTVYIPLANSTVSEFQHPVRQLVIWNLTNGDIQLSFGEINKATGTLYDNMPIPMGGYWSDDAAANRQRNAQEFNWDKYDIFYVKQLVGGTTVTAGGGNVYLTVFYARGD